MKMQKIFIPLFLLLAVGVYAQHSLSVEYQYPGNETAKQEYRQEVDVQKGEKTTALRTTWMANKPSANWFIGIEGGITNYFSERWEDNPYDKTIRPTFGINVGKWFDPVWGLRLSMTSAKLTEHDPTAADGAWNVGKEYRTLNDGTWTNSQFIHCDDLAGRLQSGGALNPAQSTIRERFLQERDGVWFTDFSYIAASIDFLINLKNFCFPYNPNSKFNPILYAGIGYGHTFGSKFDPWGELNKNQDIAAMHNVVGRAGLQLSFQISKPIAIYLGLEGLLVPESFERYVGGKRSMEGLANVTLGLTCNLKHNYSIKAPIYDPSEIDALNETINELRNRLENTPGCPVCEDCPEVVGNEKPAAEVATVLDPVFFTLDSYVVRDNQYVKILKAANYLIEHPEAKLILASYADIQTGNPPHNWTLSNNRSKAVAKVLMTKFGISKDRLIIRFYGDTVQPFEVNELNRATIFIKEQ